MDPILVDVNVHPSKLEVRLSKETELHDLIRDGIKDVFKQQQLIPSAQLPKKSAPVIKNEQQFITFDEKPPEKKFRKIDCAILFTNEAQLSRERAG